MIGPFEDYLEVAVTFTTSRIHVGHIEGEPESVDMKAATSCSPYLIFRSGEVESVVAKSA